MDKRFGPDGRVIESESAATSWLVQQEKAVTEVTSGEVAVTPGEIKQVMPGGAPTLRPALAGVKKANKLNLVLDFDLRTGPGWITSPVTTALQVSVDEGDWQTVVESARTLFEGKEDSVGPISSDYHLRVQATVDPAVLVWPNATADIEVRALVSKLEVYADKTATVISEHDGCATLTVQEVLS